MFAQAEYNQAIIIAIGKNGSEVALTFAQEMPHHVISVIVDKRYQEIADKFPELVEKIMLLADSTTERKFAAWYGYALMCINLLEGWAEKCPYCGSMMYIGVIRYVRDLPSWMLKGLSSFSALEGTGDWFFLKDDSPEKMINKFFNYSMNTGYMNAYVCRECGKMIADIKHLI